VPTLNGIVSVPSKHYREADCLQDIIDNIARIERHVEGLNQEGLAKDELRRNAVERCLERICEAAFRLGDLAVVSMPAQPWKAIRGLGNRLRHAYDQIDISIVWNVVTDRHSELKTDAGAALERLRDPLIRIEPSGPGIQMGPLSPLSKSRPVSLRRARISPGAASICHPSWLRTRREISDPPTPRFQAMLRHNFH
jgi:uncharacterized protein with HEPN domain